MWVRCYKTPELWSINALYILQSESDTLMQKGYYCSREHTSSVPVVRARTAIPSRLHRMRQPSHSREYSAHPCEYLLCIGRSGRGADSTITYSHKWCMVLDPAIYGMGAWWFERSSWLMTLPAADRKVLCLAGEQLGGPDRCSPAPPLKTAFCSLQTWILRFPNIFRPRAFWPRTFLPSAFRVPGARGTRWVASPWVAST